MRASRNLAFSVAVACGTGLIAGGPLPFARGADVVVKQKVEFRGGSETIQGFLARPQGNGPFPGIIVIHEWWGLSDWVKQNAELLAGQGYVALAVDLYHGQVTADPNKAHELMRALNQAEAVADLKGGVAYLKSLREVARDRPIGVIGWCMGGGLARELSQSSEVIGPTVICYGSVSIQEEQLARLQGKPILGIFGAEDRGIPADRVKKFASALEQKGTKVELHIYPNAGHGFMRPGGEQYNAQAAQDAWKRITDFLAANLRRKAA